jgi:hypothetical protein
VIIGDVDESEWSPRHELDVAIVYKTHTAKYCQPIASTLALHPSSEKWGTAILWSLDQKGAWWAIADGVLRMSLNVNKGGRTAQQLIRNEDIQLKAITKQLATRDAALAIWEMKYMTVGTAEVMREIAEMGVNRAKKFQWKTCTPGSSGCTHPARKLEAMGEFRKGYEGFDPRSPPWTLPFLPFISAATTSPSTPLRNSLKCAPAQGDMTSTPPIVPLVTAASISTSTPLRDGLGCASVQCGTTSRFSYKEVSSSSTEGGEGVSRKRSRNDSDSECDGPPKKSKADPDETYEPPPGERREVNARSFLQQVPVVF